MPGGRLTGLVVTPVQHVRGDEQVLLLVREGLAFQRAEVLPSQDVDFGVDEADAQPLG